MIGTTRETVSRLFGDFQKRELLDRKGSKLTLLSVPALQEMVQ
jgi:CRP-like cAMP-binding protein